MYQLFYLLKCYSNMFNIGSQCNGFFCEIFDEINENEENLINFETVTY